MTAVLWNAPRSRRKKPVPARAKNKKSHFIVAGHGTEQNENSRISISIKRTDPRAKNLRRRHAVFSKKLQKSASAFTLRRRGTLWWCPFSSARDAYTGRHSRDAGGFQTHRSTTIGMRQPPWRNPPSETATHLVLLYVGTHPQIADVILGAYVNAAAHGEDRIMAGQNHNWLPLSLYDSVSP